MDKNQLRLARRLWSLSPQQRYRFWFSPDASPGFILETNDKGGAMRLQRSVPEEAKRSLQGGAFLDGAGQLVFVGPRLSRKHLSSIAKWAAANIQDVPALVSLAGAGVARAELDPQSTEDIDALDVSALEVYRKPELWDALLRADVALVAGVLDRALPGERMWYWLWADAPPDSLPLLLQPVSTDPNTDRLNHLIEQVDPGGRAFAASGVCTVVDGGQLQLQGADLEPFMLRALARWAATAAQAHPALGRLRGCQLLRVENNRVAKIIEDDSLWSALPVWRGPGSLDEAAAVLDGLSGAKTAWFLINTSEGSLVPALSALPVEEDPEGEGFAQQVHQFARRFSAPSIAGTVKRLQSGRLLFSTNGEHTERWPEMARALVSQTTLFPMLQEARLVQLRGQSIVRVLSASEGNE